MGIAERIILMNIDVRIVLLCYLIQNINLFYWGFKVTNEIDHVQVLRKHFKDKVWRSFKNIRVLSYVAVSVIFVGGAGIWMPWLKETSVTSWLPGATVFTYSFALLGSIICNRLYFYTKSLKEIRNIYTRNGVDSATVDAHFEEQEIGSILSAWGMIFGSLIIILITIAYSKFYNQDSIYGWVGLFLSIFLYFVVSAEDLDKDSSLGDKNKEDAEPIVPTSVGSDDKEFNSDFFSDQG